MKILKIFNIAPKAIQIEFEDGEYAQIFHFGKTLYSSTSEKVKKSTLVNLKRDILLVNWSAQELEKLYV
jgi:hypothetical protein